MKIKVAAGAVLVALLAAFVFHTQSNPSDKQLVAAAPTSTQSAQPALTLNVEPTVPWPTIEPTLTPVPPTPTPKPNVSAAGAGAIQPLVQLPPSSCFDNPDRYEWRKYAVLVGFPEWALAELEYVISKESGGDLCAYNPRSSASCWIQQVPGAAQFFDPYTCMSQGYSKWLDGGQDFYRHWYRWWE